MGLSNSLMKIGRLVVRHGPKILTVSSGVLTIATAVLSFKAGAKTSEIMEDTKEQLNNCEPEDRKEIILSGVKQAAPHIILPAMTCMASIACAGKAQSINTKRILDLTQIAAFSTSQLNDISSVLKEEDKLKLRDKAVTKHLNEKPINDHYILDAGGDVYCSIPYLNVDFMSTYEDVGVALKNLSYKCDNEGGVTATDLLIALGYYEPIGIADHIYWTPSDLCMMVDKFDDLAYPMLPIRTTTVIRYDVPCLAIIFDHFNVKKY